MGEELGIRGVVGRLVVEGGIRRGRGGKKFLGGEVGDL